MLTLANATAGKLYVVKNTQGAELILERLREFGLVPMQPVQVLRRLPFSGPIIVQIGATLVALRQNEADCIVVVEGGD